jgi:hypothetical protein
MVDGISGIQIGPGATPFSSGAEHHGIECSAEAPQWANALIYSETGYFARAQGPFIRPLDMLGVVVEGGAAPDLSIVNAPVWSFA